MPENTFDGVLELIGDKKFGFIREFRPDMPKGDRDPFVSPQIINKWGLRDGLVITGELRPGRKGDMQVSRIDTVMGLPLDTWKNFGTFDDGPVIFPDEKLQLVTSPRNFTMRVIDLAAPLGKGQRALIVAPPRTGKTYILKEMARSIHENHPECELVALLVDGVRRR